MGDIPSSGDRRKRAARSWPEIVIAIGVVVTMVISLFTGLRAFYVNEYRIDILESSVKETRNDIKEARSDVRELDRSVQKLLGAAEKHGWPNK